VRLVFVTQRVDPDDPALGATVPQLRALAARVDELVVLALAARPTALPENVRVKTFGASTQAVRGARFAAALAPELRRRPVAVLAHMAPIYAVLAVPLARPLGVPVVLWFTHWRASRTLSLAERLVTRVLTVDPRSFPLASRKLVAIGHGIDVDAIPVAPGHEDGPLRVLVLGRMSPAKGLRAIVDAVASVEDAAVTAEVRGPALTDAERRHRAELEAEVDRLGLGGRVHVGGPVPRTQVLDLYGDADVLVNNMRAGALDKVVYEAAAAGLPVLVASEGFEPLVGGIEPPLRFDQDDVASIADRIRALESVGPGARHDIGLRLRERVRRDHSVDHWADAVLEALR
jgi:glycosyltransferase involved in cell wall biosynthesis